MRYSEKMNFFNIDRQYAAIQKILESHQKELFLKFDFIQGSQVKLLESTLSDYTNSECVTVGNGTDALYIALLSLNLQPDDEVIVPTFTWVSTAEVVKQVGAKLVFCDVDINTFNVDLEDLKSRITKNTKAIISVSLFGQVSNLDGIKKIIKDKEIILIEDAAQSFGAKSNKKVSCSIADISTTSFFPTKPLGCFGDGGAIFTNNDSLIEAIKVIPKHGQTNRYNYIRWGVNSRLDTYQACVLLSKLEVFESELSLRQKNASIYFEELASNNLIKLPYIEPNNFSVFAIFTLKLNDSEMQESFKKHMADHGIPTGYYYPCLHKSQPYLNGKNYLNAEFLEKSVVSIPFDAYFHEKELLDICKVINKF